MTQVGKRVELIRIKGYSNLEPGDKGVVVNIDGAGTVHIKWDNGSTLGLFPGVDKWREVEGEILDQKYPHPDVDEPPISVCPHCGEETDVIDDEDENRHQTIVEDTPECPGGVYRHNAYGGLVRFIWTEPDVGNKWG